MMRTSLIFLSMLTLFSIDLFQLSAQNQYSDFKTMSHRLEVLGRDYHSICTSKSLIKTAGGKDIWVLTIGTDEKDNKPGVAVLGGIEGNHLLGKELAFGFAELILKNASSPEIKELLDKITFYVFPDVSPDATEQFFSDLKYERVINSRSTDNDRDFVYGEDPYEDLNKDGCITLIRVDDPSGEYIESAEDNRIMIKADLSKGQSGHYLIFSEGIDNDKDGSFNEDGAGGVSFNRNFTFNYEEFGLNAGLHSVSEPETKAIADFLFDRFNIYAVFTFGPQDNLGQSLKHSDNTTGDRRITSIMKTDEVINKLVSDKYHEITGVKGSPAVKTTSGNFMDWAYFHYGRYSFSTPAWWFPVEEGKNPEVAFMKLNEKKNINNNFVKWTGINHPDFPGKKTEVGGIKPFSLINPPSDTLGDLIYKNYKFITAIASMHPELEFLDIKTDNSGGNIFRVSLKLHNKGIFSSCAEIGEKNIWTRVMRITLEPADGQTFLSGQRVQRVERLEGDESVEFNWLIKGKGSIKLSAGALNTGIITKTIELK